MENPYAGQGSVLLDIGGAVGALVVIMPPELEGAEVEISRREDWSGGHDHDHGHHHHAHAAVVARPVAGGVVHSLVFANLVEGVYELCRRPDGPVELSASITGGAVTEAVWPKAGPSQGAAGDAVSGRAACSGGLPAD